MNYTFINSATKRLNEIIAQSINGFLSLDAWRFITHKLVLWAVISSPIFIAEGYGVITANSPVPKFLSDFLSTATNLGWILGVPIVSTVIVAGFFCLIGADKFKKVAIDDARRNPGTVTAIWLVLGVFFFSLNTPKAIAVSLVFFVMAFIIGTLYFFLWGLTESNYNSDKKVDNNRQENKAENVVAVMDSRVESTDTDNRVQPAEQKENNDIQYVPR